MRIYRPRDRGNGRYFAGNIFFRQSLPAYVAADTREESLLDAAIKGCGAVPGIASCASAIYLR